MSFVDHASRPACAFVFYLRISGLSIDDEGIIFASHAVPALWNTGTVSAPTVLIDGETYKWKALLKSDQDFSAITQKLQLKSGLTRPGSVAVRFVATGTDRDNTSDTLLDLINNSLHRTDANYATLVEDLTTAGGTATVTATVGFALAPSFIHIGTECVKYTGGTSTTFTGVGAFRGRFGSFPLHHLGNPDSVREAGAGGVIVCDKPLVIEGRVLEIWLAPGRSVDGAFSPFGAAPMSTEDWNIHKGEVTGQDLSQNLLEVTIDSSSIDRMYSRDVASRLPKATAGTGLEDPWNFVGIDESNHRISWIFDDPATVAAAEHFSGVRLIRDDLVGGTEDVPDGLYFLDQAANYISWTIRNTGTDFRPFNVRITNSTQTDDCATLSVVFSRPAAIDVGSRSQLQVVVDADDLLWPDLGITESQIVQHSIDPTPVGFEVIADTPAPVFRWPANGLPRRLYYHTAEGPTFDESPGILDDKGAAVAAYIRIGEDEVVRFTAAPAVQGGVTYIEVDGRDTLGSFLVDDIYVEWEATKDEAPQIVQGLAFPGCSFFRMLLYLMLTDGGLAENHPLFDVMWRGAGAGIPVDLVNVI